MSIHIVAVILIVIGFLYVWASRTVGDKAMKAAMYVSANMFFITALVLTNLPKVLS